MNKQYLNVNSFLEIEASPLHLIPNSISYEKFIKNILLEESIPNLNNALLSACTYGNVELVELLLNNPNYNIDVSIYDNAAICLSAQVGSQNIVSLLVDRGADPQARGELPLQLAAAQGHFDLVKYLIKLGCEYSAAEYLPFWLAAEHGHIRLVRYLYNLEKVNVWFYGDFIIKKAAIAGHYEVVDFLLDRGVSISSCNECLNIICHKGYHKTLRVLLKHDINIHRDQESALHSAVFANNYKSVDLLLQNGADIRAQQDKAIKIAKYIKNERIINAILSRYKGLAYIWAILYVRLLPNN